MTTRPLPDELADLSFSLAGKKLALHPVPWEEGMYAIGLEPPRSSWGLFVDIEGHRGRRHDSQTVTEYCDGHMHGHVRQLQDHAGTPAEFWAWLRAEVIRLIHGLVRRHIDGTYARLEGNGDDDGDADDRRDDASDADVLVSMCRDLAALPPLPTVTPQGCQSICDALVAILRAHERGTMEASEAAVVRAFLDEYSKRPIQEHLRDKTIQHAFALLPDDIPDLIRGYLEDGARAQVDRYTAGGELTVDNVASLGRLLEMQPAHLRPIYNALVLPRCDTAALCFAMATALCASPAEAAAHVARGLALSPTHSGLRRLQEMLADGASPSLEEAAQQASAYERMLPRVLYNRRDPDLNEDAQRLLEVEAWLNRFWNSVLPPHDDPDREEIVATLCVQQRFKARGSEGYLTWIRTQHHLEDGVAYFLGRVRDHDLTVLQHRGDWHCGPYLAQGFSCMLDTQRPEHIEQALEVIDDLESELSWKNQHVFYALACVASRAGQLDRAVRYARESVALGHDVTPMFKDPDFANLMADPECAGAIRALLE